MELVDGNRKPPPKTPTERCDNIVCGIHDVFRERGTVGSLSIIIHIYIRGWMTRILILLKSSNLFFPFNRKIRIRIAAWYLQ